MVTHRMRADIVPSSPWNQTVCSSNNSNHASFRMDLLKFRKNCILILFVPLSPKSSEYKFDCLKLPVAYTWKKCGIVLKVVCLKWLTNHNLGFMVFFKNVKKAMNPSPLKNYLNTKYCLQFVNLWIN